MNYGKTIFVKNENEEVWWGKYLLSTFFPLKTDDN
jgi:hypothetical protein